MAVKFKGLPVEEDADELESAVVDSAGMVFSKIQSLKAQLKPLEAEYAKLMADLGGAGVVTTASADKAVYMMGLTHQVEFAAVPNKTEIVKPLKVLEILSNINEDLPAALMKWGITDLKMYLTPAEMDEVTVTERAGKRRTKITKI